MEFATFGSLPPLNKFRYDPRPSYGKKMLLWLHLEMGGWEMEDNLYHPHGRHQTKHSIPMDASRFEARARQRLGAELSRAKWGSDSLGHPGSSLPRRALGLGEECQARSRKSTTAYHDMTSAVHGCVATCLRFARIARITESPIVFVGWNGHMDDTASMPSR